MKSRPQQLLTKEPCKNDLAYHTSPRNSQVVNEHLTGVQKEEHGFHSR